MTYAIIQPPFTLKFREMSKQELKDYYQWFFKVLRERIIELRNAVVASPGFVTWASDETPASVEALGIWFASQVETRPRTGDAIDKIEERSPFKIDVSDEELTNRTFSLSMDIGMYLSQVLLAQHPHLKWHQPLDDKKFVDYGQPVLIGFGRVPLNPVRIAITLSYGIASGKQRGHRIKELYDYWSQQAAKNRN